MGRIKSSYGIRDQRPEGRTIPEESPLKSSGSNDFVERESRRLREGLEHYCWDSRRE